MTTAATIKLPAPELTLFRLRLEGTSPLITDAFSDPRKAKLASTMDGSPKAKKTAREPERDFREGMYHTADGSYGIPKLAFRKSIQSAAIRATEIKGTNILASFAIDSTEECLPLITGEPRMRIDHVVHGMGADLAYRPEFWPWSVILPIRLDHEVVSLEQFIHVVYKAGLGIGIGNWRPEKRGDYGCWTVAELLDVRVLTGKA